MLFLKAVVINDFSINLVVSGEIALHTKNQGYNATYSQGGLSFEGALLDAILLTKKLLKLK